MFRRIIVNLDKTGIMSKKITNPESHDINYKSKRGCVEMHVSINSPIEDVNSSVNMAMADAMLEAVIAQAKLTGRYDDPIHQPTYLN